MKNPKISLCVPIHEMQNKMFFLNRLWSSIDKQSYKNFEVVMTEEGMMAPNTNAAIKRATGDIIKILYSDDYLADEGSLQRIVEAFTGGWLVTGCLHDDKEHKFNPHYPTFRPEDKDNFVGSPSVLTFENKDPLLFDETMTWLLDFDLYKRLYARYGMPTILNDLNVVIGIGPHQTTHILSDEVKLQEHNYLIKKHG